MMAGATKAGIHRLGPQPRPGRSTRCWRRRGQHPQQLPHPQGRCSYFPAVPPPTGWSFSFISDPPARTTSRCAATISPSLPAQWADDFSVVFNWNYSGLGHGARSQARAFSLTGGTNLLDASDSASTTSSTFTNATSRPATTGSP